MTAVELARLILEVRNAQRRYFRTKAQGALEESKRLERRLDLAVEEVLRQPTLFDRYRDEPHAHYGASSDGDRSAE